MEGGLKLPRHWLLRALELETDRDRSPSELVREAVGAFRDAVAESWTPDADEETVRGRLQIYAARLERARPGSPAIASRLRLCTAALAQGRDAALAGVEEVLRETEGAAQGLVQAAERLLGPGTRVLTCGYDEAVEAILNHYSDRWERTTVCEFSPRREGARLAGSLGELALPVRLITLAHLEVFGGELDVALAPVDRILPGGDAVAATGTAVLARVCGARRIPFYVIAERARWIPEGDDLARFHLERRSPADLFTEIPEGVEAVHIAFDRTPAELITGYVTEAGIVGAASEVTRAA